MDLTSGHTEQISAAASATSAHWLAKSNGGPGGSSPGLGIQVGRATAGLVQRLRPVWWRHCSLPRQGPRARGRPWLSKGVKSLRSGGSIGKPQRVLGCFRTSSWGPFRGTAGHDCWARVSAVPHHAAARRRLLASASQRPEPVSQFIAAASSEVRSSQSAASSATAAAQHV